MQQATEQLWQLLLQLQATPGQPQLEAGARDVCSQLASACGLSSSEELTSQAAPSLLQHLQQARSPAAMPQITVLCTLSYVIPCSADYINEQIAQFSSTAPSASCDLRLTVRASVGDV